MRYDTSAALVLRCSLQMSYVSRYAAKKEKKIAQGEEKVLKRAEGSVEMESNSDDHVYVYILRIWKRECEKDGIVEKGWSSLPSEMPSANDTFRRRSPRRRSAFRTIFRVMFCKKLCATIPNGRIKSM